MFKNQFDADNSRFGAALTRVMRAHGIGVKALLGECRVQARRVVNVKKA